MKKLSFILTIILGFGLSSCSVGRYVNPSQNLNLNQTQVVLSEANFKVVKHVSLPVIYTQSAMLFDSDQLKQGAYAELLRKANLTGSQALINVTVELVERKSNMSGKKEWAIIASGIVIEFINPNAPQDDFVTGGAIGGGSLSNGGTIAQSSPHNIKGGNTIQTIATEPAQPTEEEALQAEYLALKAKKGEESGDKSLLGKYKRAHLVFINASTAGEKECEKYKKNFMSRFNELIYGQWSKNFELKNNAQELTAELIIIDYSNDVASGFIRFKDASGSVLYSRCLTATSARTNAAGFASLLQTEFESSNY